MRMPASIHLEAPMDQETRNRVAVDELLGEAELALAMADLTTTRDDHAIVEQTLDRGERAYGDILRRQNGVVLSMDEADLLQARLDRLRARLKFLGAAV